MNPLLSLFRIGPFFNGVIQNIIAGLIGAALTTVLTISYRYTRNRLIERQLNVSGKYISTFEDTQNGVRHVIYAAATIRQRGLHIYGTSSLYPNQPGKERSWALKGELFDKSTILGTYTCTTAHQRGIGTFSLEIKDRSLDGYWTGYDSDNRIMNHGVYRFVRVLDVTIDPFRDEDTPALVSVASKTLGRMYFNDPRRYLSSPSSHILVAREKKTHLVVGFIAGKCLPKGQLLSKYGSLSRKMIPLDIREADKVGRLGVIEEMGVHPKYQGRGTGRSLIERMETTLRSSSTTVIVPTWRFRQTNEVEPILLARGYEPFCELPQFWKNDCDRGAFACPARSQDRCQCDLVFFKSNETEPALERP
jgi:ribosomal protein S18 acetylase RimI-like enzyme